MMKLSPFGFSSLLALLLSGAASSGAYPATLPELDPAWTEQCVALRKDSRNLTSTLLNYCACMQEFIGNGQSFKTAADLERAAPRVHRSCARKSGLRPN